MLRTLLLLAACGAAAGQSPPAEPQVLVLGRASPGPGNIASLPQLMTWPASSATIAFANASSVTVVINGTEAGLPGPAGPLIAQEITFFPWSFFQIDVDGKPVVTGNVSDNATVWRWTSDPLAPGQHVLTVWKLSEPLYGSRASVWAATARSCRRPLRPAWSPAGG